MVIRDDRLMHERPAPYSQAPLVSSICSLICLVAADHRPSGNMTSGTSSLEAIELDDLDPPKCRRGSVRAAANDDVQEAPAVQPELESPRGLDPNKQRIVPDVASPQTPKNNAPWCSNPDGRDGKDPQRSQVKQNLQLLTLDCRAAQNKKIRNRNTPSNQSISASSHDLIRHGENNRSHGNTEGHFSCLDLREQWAKRNPDHAVERRISRSVGGSRSPFHSSTGLGSRDGHSSLLDPRDGHFSLLDIRNNEMDNVEITITDAANETTRLLQGRRPSRHGELVSAIAKGFGRGQVLKHPPARAETSRRRGDLASKDDADNERTAETPAAPCDHSSECAILHLDYNQTYRDSVELSDAPSQNSQLSDSDSPLIDAHNAARGQQRHAHPIPRRRPFMRRSSINAAKKGHVAVQTKQCKTNQMCSQKLAGEKSQAKKAPTGYGSSRSWIRHLPTSTNKPSAFKSNSSKSVIGGRRGDHLHAHAHMTTRPRAHSGSASDSISVITTSPYEHSSDGHADIRFPGSGSHYCGYCRSASLHLPGLDCEIDVHPTLLSFTRLHTTLSVLRLRDWLTYPAGLALLIRQDWPYLSGRTGLTYPAGLAYLSGRTGLTYPAGLALPIRQDWPYLSGRTGLTYTAGLALLIRQDWPYLSGRTGLTYPACSTLHMSGLDSN
ncbi:hypothetical protein Btru_046055 [Bulinus truncatus]|nr:hypothetical protein Btru_046055 [Bulinus truncatus]